MKKRTFSTAIIGAGISGLCAGKKLSDAGHDIIIIEKSRGVGGRISTRWSNSGATFDHGCQFLPSISKDLDFTSQLKKNLLKWNPKINPSSFIPEIFSHGYQIGSPKMNSFPKSLSANLNIATEWHASDIYKEKNKWIIEEKDGKPSITADLILSTIPAPQAKLLLSKTDFIHLDKLENIKYNPIISILVEDTQLLNLPYDIYTSENEPIETIVLQHSKPHRPAIGSLVGMGSKTWSAKSIDAPTEELQLSMTSSIEKILEKNITSNGRIHKWRYAFPKNSLKKNFLSDENQKIVCCGDWCLGDSANDALLSGMHAANLINQLISSNS